MKTVKVGTWYNKLTPSAQEYFKNKVEKFGTQKLRSYFTVAKKQFGLLSNVCFEDGLNLKVNNELYYFSYDRKEFCKFQK